jgi:phage baseplate assembly protein W
MEYLYEVTPKESRQFRDISLSFSKNPVTGDINILKNDNAIKNAVKNIILTKPGEKLYEPYFGSKVTDLLFETVDFLVLDQMRDEIFRVLRQYEPRIDVEDVELTYNEQDLNIDCIISYKIVGQLQTQQLSFLLEPR